MANFQLIRDLCESRGITIRELTKRLGWSDSTIQSIIRNGSTSTLSLEAIAKELNVHPGYFFDGWHGLNEYSQLEKENEMLRALAEDKERMIKLLMEVRKSRE